MKGYSLVEPLINSLIQRRDFHFPSSSVILTAEERLFIVQGSGEHRKPAEMAQLYLDCRCFAEAYAGFLEIRHHRKLGDVAWALGDIDLAVSHYLDVSPGYQSYRKSPDYDRLIRLAFIRNDTAGFFEWFIAADFAPESRDLVCLGCSAVSSRPYLEMLAVQSRLAPERMTDEFLKENDEIFGISPHEWRSYAADPRFDDPAVRAEIAAHRLPIPCRNPPVDLVTALADGDTPRSRRTLEKLLDVDRIVNEAQDALECYRDTGSETDLQAWVERIIPFGDDGLISYILFATLGHGSFEADPPLIDRLRTSHPVIQRQISALEGRNRTPRQAV